MPSPNYLKAGYTPNSGDNTNAILHKILGALISTINGLICVVESSPGANSLSHDQVAVNETPAQIVPERPNRRSITLKNLHATLPVFVGGSGVHLGIGFPVAPGEGLTLEMTGAIYAVAGGEVTVAFIEEFTFTP
jgi:hypothetical protein